MTRPVLYCILVHDSPLQVTRLFRALYNETDHFIVHVDQNAAPAFKAVIAGLAHDLANVRVLSTRICAWGGFSLVDATLDMLREGLVGMADWTEAILLSGTHLPLWPRPRIREWVAGGRSIMRWNEFPQDSSDGWYKTLTDRIAYAYVEKPGVGMVRGQKLGPPTFRYYQGSQWHVLARADVAYVLAEVDRQGEIPTRLSRSNIADEAFFQTILRNAARDVKFRSAASTATSWQAGRANPETLDFLGYRRAVTTVRLPFVRKIAEDLGDETLVDRFLTILMGEPAHPKVVRNIADMASDGRLKRTPQDRGGVRRMPAVLTPPMRPIRPARPMRNAVIYRARGPNPSLRREIARLARELPGFAVFVVGYQSNYSADRNHGDGQFYYGKTDLEGLPYPQKLANIDWRRLTGHHDLPVLRFFHQRPDFDHYWIIEDDVRCSGPWPGICADLSLSAADLLMPAIQNYQENRQWYWWDSLGTGGEAVAREHRLKGFGPFYRASNRCMRAVDEKYRHGWTGHFEVTWPTIAHVSGLTVEDVGGHGSYAPADRRGRFYRAEIQEPHLFPGTFVFRPAFLDAGDSEFGSATIHETLLWHPVKHTHPTEPPPMSDTPSPEMAAAVLPDEPADAVAESAQDFLDRGASPLDIIGAALTQRDLGAVDDAANLLRELIQLRPETNPAYYELAFLHRLRGEHLEAALVLSESQRRSEPEARTGIFLAHMLFALGARDEAERALGAVTPGDQTEAAAVAAMFELGAYLEGHSIGRALFLLEELRARAPFLATADVAETVAEALRERQPFALVRLGDGAGACLRRGAREEHACRVLYGQNRSEFMDTWFGPEFQPQASGFLDTTGRLLDATADCDLIGIPDRSRLTHEYAISSPRGIPSLVNLIRALLDGAMPPQRHFCSGRVHLDLEAAGLLMPILKKERRLSVITAIDDLPQVLRMQFGIGDVILHRAPGPEVFEELQAELAEPHDGRLFLVAAGILGKLYAATIRQHGGIALDIGSVAEIWTGKRK